LPQFLLRDAHSTGVRFRKCSPPCPGAVLEWALGRRSGREKGERRTSAVQSASCGPSRRAPTVRGDQGSETGEPPPGQTAARWRKKHCWSARAAVGPEPINLTAYGTHPHPPNHRAQELRAPPTAARTPRAAPHSSRLRGRHQGR
jgi:hypothetical protein